MKGFWKRMQEARRDAVTHRRAVESAHGYRRPGNSSNWGVGIAGAAIALAMVVAGAILAIGFAVALTDPQAWVSAYLELKEFADTRNSVVSR